MTTQWERETAEERKAISCPAAESIDVVMDTFGIPFISPSFRSLQHGMLFGSEAAVLLAVGTNSFNLNGVCLWSLPVDRHATTLDSNTSDYVLGTDLDNFKYQVSWLL